MTDVQTAFYRLSVPEIFEKVLVVGQLLRAERMDREEGERSFAELNFFVGRGRNEQLELPSGSGNEELFEALWQRHLSRETAVNPEDPPQMVEQSRGETERSAVLDLSEESWRPPSRQVIFLRGFGGGQFASFVLEYDRAFEAHWGPLARDLWRAIEWTGSSFTEEQFEHQAQRTWSCFDDMSEERRAAITLRYMALVQPGSAPVMASKAADPIELDLTAGDLAQSEGWRKWLSSPSTPLCLHTSLFVEPIEVEFESPFEAARHGDDLLAMLRHLSGANEPQRDQAARLAWKHAQFHFEVTDYGAPKGTSNEDYFEIRGQDDAWRDLGPGSLTLTGDPDDGSAELFRIDFYPPWEDEHGCCLLMRAGVFVDALSHGDGLG